MSPLNKDKRWESRPWAARAIQFVAFAGPFVVAVLATIWIGRLLPEPQSFGAAVGAWLLLGLIATGIVQLLDRLARRILPFAALLKLSLAFPGSVPSRYKVARARGGSRELQQEVEDAREQGLSSDRTEAAVTVLRLVAALSTHDRATRGHAERVRVFVDMIAEEMDITGDDVDRLRWAALLHDVGKIAVHPDVLNDPGRPSDEAWELLRSHPLEGARITAPLRPWLGHWALAIEQHHERWDGEGYPYGLGGENLSLGARVVSVADAYDVMTAARAYKTPLPAAEAREELARHAGTQFDPEVVRAFLSIPLDRLRWAVGPFSWFVSTPFGRPFQVLSSGAGAVTAAAAAAIIGAAGYGLPPSTPADLPEIADVADEPAPSEEPVAQPTPSPEASPSPSPEASPSPVPSPAPVPEPEPEPAPPVVTPDPPPPPPPPGEVVVAGETVEASEDDVVVIDVLSNDVSGSGEPLVLIDAVASVGDVVFDPSGIITWTPPTDFSGEATITYVVSDGLSSATGTVTIRVAPVNDPPVLADDIASVTEDTPLVIDLLGDDVDPDGDVLRIVGFDLTGVTHGTIVDNGDGTITYTPNPNAVGVDTLVYIVSDGTVERSATVDIVIVGVNDPPVAVADTVTMDEDTTVVVNVLANDSDPDGDPLTVTSVTMSNATTTIVPGGIRITPAPNRNGTLTGTYTISDGKLSATTMLRVIVRAVNDPPVLSTAPVTVAEDTPTVIDLLATASDVDGDTLTVTALDLSGVTTGSVTDNGDGTITYTPDPDATGTDTISYTVSDGTTSTTGTLTVDVVGVEDPPVAGDDSVTMNEDATTTVDVLANDSDGDGDTLSIVSVSLPGATTSIGPGGVTVAPTPDTSGTLTGTVTITDGTTNVTSNLTVDVLPVNDAPTITAGPDVGVPANSGPQTVAGWASDITPGPADEAGQVLSLGVVVDQPALFTTQPTLDLGSGDLTFEFGPGVTGSASVTFTLTDDGGTANGGVDATSVTVTIGSAAIAPTAVDDSVTLDEDTQQVFDVLANDDDGGGALTITAIDDSTLTLGSVTDLGGGNIRYTADPDANGTDTFTYTVDNGLGTDTATVTVQVTPVNDAPVGVDDAYTTTRDTTLVVGAALGVVANDTDVDGDTLTAVPGTLSQPPFGTVGTLNADGSFDYTPPAGFVGTASFTYTVTDGTDTDTATVDIEVTPPVLTTTDLFLRGQLVSILDPTRSVLSTSPPTISSGAPLVLWDWDLNGDPGRTLQAGTSRMDETDPQQYHEWLFTPSTDLVLDGPISLTLFSVTDAFDVDERVDYGVGVYECTPADVCTLLQSVEEVRVDDWNPTGTWSEQVLPVGDVFETIEAGNTLLVKLVFDNNDVLIALTSDRISKLTYSTPE